MEFVMPTRLLPLVINEYYHIFNRGINKQPIFLGIRDYRRITDVLDFYSFADLSLRFSKFLLLSKEERIAFWNRVKKENERLVEIICYCIMPNHFHILLKQKEENGISKFMATLQNSYTRYFNTKHGKIGPILQGQFKAVRIEDENQLFHVSRYIHLNPYSSFVVKELIDLKRYPWSSLLEYIGESNARVCSKEVIIANFKKDKNYQQFVFDQADYQRRLEEIKHLLLE